MEENKNVTDIELLDRYKDICKNVPTINEFYSKIDESIKYKDLTFYPVKMKFYLFFQIFSECLTLRKNKVTNPSIIKIKYLDYLFYEDNTLDINNLIYVGYLRELLWLCLRIPQEFSTSKGTKLPTIDFINQEGHWYIKIYNHTYDNADLLEIRKIIASQNNLEIPDESIHPDIERKYNEHKEYLLKTGKIKTQDIGDLILCVVAKTNYKKEEVLNLSIKTFFDLIDRLDLIINYEITSLLAPYLEKNTIEKLPYWTDRIKKLTKLEEMSSSLQDFENKIKGTQK